MAAKKRQDKVAKKRDARKKAVRENNRKKRQQELEWARLQELPAEEWVMAHAKEIASTIKDILQKAEESPDQGARPADIGNETTAGAADPAAELLARARAWAANTLAMDDDGAVAMCNDLLTLARTGCWEAMDLLCTLYRNKRPELFSEDRKLDIAEQLLAYAEKDHVDALALVGRFLADGTLFDKDPEENPEETFNFLQHAWENGSVEAGNRLALLFLEYENALGASQGIPILLSNAQSGNVEAMELLGESLVDTAYDSPLHDFGMHLLYLAGRRGRPGTFLRIILHGCVESGFMDTLHSALEDPALDGPAQWCLRGRARLAGLGYAPSVEEGLALLERSADAGFNLACGHLAGIHLCGLWGVEPDREKASAWIARGIELDDPRCLALEPLIPLLSPAGCRDFGHWNAQALQRILWSSRKLTDALTDTCGFLSMALEPDPQTGKRPSVPNDPGMFVDGISISLEFAERQLDPLPFFLVAGMLDALGGEVEGEETDIALDICDYFFRASFAFYSSSIDSFDSLDECIYALNRFGAILATPNSLDRLLRLEHKAHLIEVPDFSD